jgi:hypothetical protein
VLPKTTVLDVSVDGPTRHVVRVANAVATDVTATAAQNFPTIVISKLDAATTSTLIQPKTRQSVLYGALAGLLIGFAVAALWGSLGQAVDSSLSSPDGNERPTRRSGRRRRPKARGGGAGNAVAEVSARRGA